MKKLCIYFCVVLLFSCSSNNYLSYQGSEYLLGGAHDAHLGSIGFYSFNHKRYESVFNPIWNDLNIIHTTKFSDFVDNYVVDYDLTQNSYSLQETTKLKKNEEELQPYFEEEEEKFMERKPFHIFRIGDTASLVANINSPANQRRLQYVAQDPDFRIVTAIVILVDDEVETLLTKSKELSVLLTARRKGSRREMVFHMSTESDSKYTTMSDVYIYGYEISGLCWDATSKVPKLALVVPVRYGEEVRDCPTGTIDSLAFLSEDSDDE